MWVFSEAADWFDRQRVLNHRFLDQTFQGWVDYAVKHEDERGYWPALRNAMIYSGTGLLDGLHEISTSVASGFVDTLRIGDGVRLGGWGYAQDALRLMSVVGAAARPINGVLKVGRLGLASLVAVDPAPSAPICTWVAAAKALVMTGTRHFATVATIAEAFEWPWLYTEFREPVFLEMLLKTLQRLGAAVTDAGPLTGTVEDALIQVLKANPDSVMPFSVIWEWGIGPGIREFADLAEDDIAGHTMLAFLHPLTGELRILDRTGEIFRSLEELDHAGYSGIRNAVFHSEIWPELKTALIIEHAVIVTVLKTGQTLGALAQGALTPFRGPDGTLWSDPTWVTHGVGLEIRSVPMRTEPRAVVHAPLRVVAAKGQVQTQTFCVPILRNSEAAPDAATEDCSVLRTYVVQSGDTLAAVAQSAYGNPSRWRALAGVNGIKDPDALKPGTILVIP